MMFIYKIIVVIELFLIYPLVFLNIRFGTAGLGTVGTILGTVAAAGICQNVNADAVAFCISGEVPPHGRSDHRVFHPVYPGWRWHPHGRGSDHPDHKNLGS